MDRIRLSLAAAAAVVVAVGVVGVVGLNLMPRQGGLGPGASLTTTPSASVSATLVATPPPTLGGSVEVDPKWGDYSIGRHHQYVDGVAFTVLIPGRGWEPTVPRGISMPALDGQARISVNRSYHGPQDAEAMIYWTSPFGALYTDPCQKVLGTSAEQPIAELASVVAAAPGTELVSGPSDVTLGGRSAKFIALRVSEDMGCSPGYFFSWDSFPGGALWLGADVGDTIRVWIVDLGGRNLFIAAETRADAEAGAGSDVREIVESIQFE